MCNRRVLPTCAACLFAISLTLVSCSGDDGPGGTGPGDITPPSVVSVTPGSGTADVDVATTLVVTFSEPIDAASVDAATIDLAPDATRAAGVPGTPTVSNSQLTFVPDEPLSHATPYRVEIAATVTDMAANALGDVYVWTFTTAEPPQAPLEVPLAEGNAWLYYGESSGSVWSQYGYSSSSSEELRVLFVERAAAYEGHDGWLVRNYTLDQTVTTETGLRSEYFYLDSDVDGLYRAEPDDDDGWLNVILFTAANFSDSSFMLADGPAHSDGTTLGVGSVQVPAGSFQTLTIEHDYTSTGPYAPEDIFETRYEHYADGVGLVRASWNYSFDDNDPSGFDITAQGYAELIDVMNGPSLPYLAAELEPNDDGGPAASQTFGPFALVTGSVHIDDAGLLAYDDDFDCLDAECILPNIDGAPRLQDWYVLDVATAGQYRLDLVYEFYDSDTQVWNDLDLYVFMELGDGSVVYAARADDEAGNPEWVVFTYMPAGRYYLAVQAWDTPVNATPYTLSMSKQAVPVKAGGAACGAAGLRASASSGK